MNFSYHLLQNWEYSTSKSQQHNESCCIFKILQCQLWFQKQAQNWGHGNFRQVTTTLWSRNLFQEDCDYLKWQQRMFFSNTEHRIKPQMQLQWWLTSVNNLSAVQSLVLKSLQTWNSQGGWQSFLHPDSSHFPINWNHGVFSYPLGFFGWFLVFFFVVGLFFFFFCFSAISSVFFEQPSLLRMGHRQGREALALMTVVWQMTTLSSKIHWPTQRATQQNNDLQHLCWCCCVFNRVFFNVMFNKWSKNEVLKTNFRWLSQFIHLTGKRSFHIFQEASSSDFSQL